MLPLACDLVWWTFSCLICSMQKAWYFAGFCCEKSKSLMSYMWCYRRHLQLYEQSEYKHQICFLQYVLMVVPPRTCWVFSLRHSSVALWWVKFLSDRTVCDELIVFDRLLSTGLLLSVQKILSWTHEVWHTTSISDLTSMYISLGTTLQVFSCWPAGNGNVI